MSLSGFNRAVRRLFAVPVVALGLAAAPLAYAENYQAGLAAVDAGEMALAVSIWEDLIATNAPDRPQAQYALALLYETGRAVPWDETKAAELYQASGLPEALTNLGLMYAEGRGVEFDPSKAAELWQEAADQGHTFAMFNLGLAYYAGDGVDKNAVRALELIYDAGEGGLAEAQWAVCQFFERGVGVEASPSQALVWCQRAGDQGHAQAQAVALRLEEQLEGDLIDSMLAEQAVKSEQAAVPETNPDDVMIDDQTLEFGVEPEVAQDPVLAETPAIETPAETTTPESIDPVLLLGSEFEEFADLLAPLDDTGAPGSDINNEEDLNALSSDADEIAALIDSAGPVSEDLPDLEISEQPDPSSLLRNEAVKRGAPLSLQEMVDGELALGQDQGAGAPPLPESRPELSYAIPPVIEGPVFAVWLGTGETVDEARGIYELALKSSPAVVGIMEAAYQNDSLSAEETGLSGPLPVVRVLLGPLPGEAYAWQICNLLRSQSASLFCAPLEIEG